MRSWLFRVEKIEKRTNLHSLRVAKKRGRGQLFSRSRKLEDFSEWNFWDVVGLSILYTLMFWVEKVYSESFEMFEDLWFGTLFWLGSGSKNFRGQGQNFSGEGPKFFRWGLRVPNFSDQGPKFFRWGSQIFHVRTQIFQKWQQVGPKFFKWGSQIFQVRVTNF